MQLDGPRVDDGDLGDPAQLGGDGEQVGIVGHAVDEARVEPGDELIVGADGSPAHPPGRELVGAPTGEATRETSGPRRPGPA